MGISRFRLGKFEEAIACFDMALKHRPDDPHARWNRATALLSLGEYERGFIEHDVAWRLFHWRGFGPVGHDIDRVTHLPLWRGERNVRLLAYHELGYGDAIMAMRYLPELKRRCEVTLVIDQSLARLARSFGVEVTDHLPDNLTGYDFRLPFFGVMSALGETATSIPNEPYIFSVAGPLKRSIGIAWSGRTQTSFTLQRFLSLLATQGRELYALQPGPTGDDRVEEFPPWCDFADLADRIAAMEHVVCVDTAAIHLAGAIGHPSAHLVLPHFTDWRWHHTGRWYPKLHTYRQDNPEDWHAPFARLNERLNA